MNWQALWAQIGKLNKKIDDMETIELKKVEELPETGEPNTIYLVPKATAEEGNYSDEYIWDDDLQEFEKVGDTLITPEENIVLYEARLNGVSIFDGSIVLKNDKTGNDLLSDINDNKIPLIYFRYSYSLFILSFLCYDHVNNLIFFSLYDRQSSGTNMHLGHYIFKISSNTSSEVFLKFKYGKDILLNPQYNDIGKVLGLVNQQNSASWGLITLPSQPTDYTKDTATAPLYDNTATYAVGDICTHDKELYKCNTTIDPAEEWNSTHWDKTDIFSEMPVQTKPVIYYNIAFSQNTGYYLTNSKKFSDIKNSIDDGYDVRLVLKSGYDILNIFLLTNRASNIFYFCNFRTYSSFGSFRSILSIRTTNNLNDYIFTDITDSNLLPKATSNDANKIPIINSYGNWALSALPTVPTDYAKDSSVAPLYDSTATYALGDLVMHDKELHKCTTPISTAEEWNSSKWDAVTVLDIIDSKIGDAITSVLNTSF